MHADDVTVSLTINGEARELAVDPRTTVLDALRERLGLTGAKKGCDHGQCGACTVLLDGRRVNSCLVFAVAAGGSELVTIEGLAGTAQLNDTAQLAGTAQLNDTAQLAGTAQLDEAAQLHPVQQAFLERDAFQCGYCTPGQICSAVGMLAEWADGWPSAVTDRLADQPELTDAEIRERMSGNLCRCGAYANIVPAIRQAATG